MTKSMPSTQYDVARLTGLSQATISRALRGDPTVLPETRARILNVCRELNYRPSMGGRLLAQGPRAMMGISLSPRALPTDRYVSILHQALVRELQNTGWGVLLLSAGELLDGLGSVGTVILSGIEEADARVGLCRKAGLPFVGIGYLGSDCFAVVPDDAEGPKQAVRHFHAMGRRSLGFLSSFAHDRGPAMALRAKAIEDEAKASGMTLRVIDARVDVTSTLAGYRSVMQNPGVLDGLDCLFCDTDEHALGVLAALDDLGVPYPGRITVVGFDDLPGLSRQLSTIRQDFSEIARAAVALTVEAQEGLLPRRVVVPVSLQVRGT
jgi:LacI family transcriptional regulator